MPLCLFSLWPGQSTFASHFKSLLFQAGCWIFFLTVQTDAACNFDKLLITIHRTSKKETEKIVIMLCETPIVI